MRRVFRRPFYLLLSTFIALAVFLYAVLSTSFPLYVALATRMPLSDALALAWTFIVSSIAQPSLPELAFVIAMAALIGMNIALLLFYFRLFRAAPGSAGVASGILGGIAAILGFGCAACGSVFLVSLAASVGGSSLLTLLPFGGSEFGYAGLVLLVISTVYLVRAINKPPVCPI